MTTAAQSIREPADGIVRRISDALVTRDKLLLLLLLIPPVLWLGVVYLGSLFALLAQSFFSIDEFSGTVVREPTLKTYGELLQPANLDLILRTIFIAAIVTVLAIAVNWQRVFETTDPLARSETPWAFWTAGTCVILGLLIGIAPAIYAAYQETHRNNIWDGIAKVASLAACFAVVSTNWGLVGVIIAAGIPTSLIAGAWSDRVGRKPLVFLSGGIMAAAALAFILAGLGRSIPGMLCVGALFGVGYGAYQAADWALAIDVLPPGENTGKDMGIWHVALVLPQVLAPAATGFVLTALKERSLLAGYTMVFVMTAAWFVLGTVLVRQIRGVR